MYKSQMELRQKRDPKINILTKFWQKIIVLVHTNIFWWDIWVAGLFLISIFLKFA